MCIISLIAHEIKNKVGKQSPEHSERKMRVKEHKEVPDSRQFILCLDFAFCLGSVRCFKQYNDEQRVSTWRRGI